MTLNKLEYLQKCRDMWAWLADHPDKNKWDYFTEVVGGSPDTWPYNECWACEQHNQERGLLHPCVDTCMLNSLWPDGCNDTLNSPYNLWFIAHMNKKYKDATRHALLIVKGCDDAIKEIQNGCTDEKEDKVSGDVQAPVVVVGPASAGDEVGILPGASSAGSTSV